ncbi:hypothetical protein B0H21DRAFT_543429 [Amylocystis lapponica]|nr:hypothetical protein B0H21DRAFT_543429 [Amylocystis lapponica]
MSDFSQCLLCVVTLRTVGNEDPRELICLCLLQSSSFRPWDDFKWRWLNGASMLQRGHGMRHNPDPLVQLTTQLTSPSEAVLQLFMCCLLRGRHRATTWSSGILSSLRVLVGAFPFRSRRTKQNPGRRPLESNTPLSALLPSASSRVWCSPRLVPPCRWLQCSLEEHWLSHPNAASSHHQQG